MAGTYDFRLVALSIVMAIVASFAALELTGRVTASRRKARKIWLFGGATAMGLGIWSMHYIGMLAYKMPMITVYYDVPTVAISLLAAIGASIVALFTVSRKKVSLQQIAVGGVVMGSGIAAMHYTGMAAMRMQARVTYNALLVFVSIVLAVVISVAALVLAFRIRDEKRTSGRKIGSAFVMGSAIPIMHYTGMMAASFSASDAPLNRGHAVSVPAMGIALITIGTLLVLSFVIGSASLDRLATAGKMLSQYNSELAALNKELEKRIAESTLARAELDRYFTLSSDMLCIAGTDGYFKRVNPAWEKALGWSTEELTAKPYLEFVHPDDRVATAKEAGRQAAGMDAVRFENRYRCKNGSYRWLMWNAAVSKENQLIYATARDMTEPKKTSQALKESELRFRALLEGVKDYAIFMLDPVGRIISWNAGAERIKGYRAHEILGKHFSIFFTPDETEKNKPLKELELATLHGSFSEEAQRVRKNGTLFWASVLITALRDEKGALIGFAKVTKDITEIKHAREALIRAKEEAERSVRFKDQFLSTMSHELRTPLNAVLGFSDLLADTCYGPLNEKQRRYVNHISNGGKHLLRLITDILDLSKIEAGRLQLTLQSVPVEVSFSEAADNLNPLIGRKQQTLEKNAAPGLQVRADATRLKQILMNLIGNAVKFTPEGGRIELAAIAVGDMVRLEVRDSGPGIPLEEQKRIFEAFYRLRQTDKTVEGTGLGLAITQRLVELHGGELGLESTPGSGSCFYFTLPRVSAPTQSRMHDTNAAEELSEPQPAA